MTEVYVTLTLTVRREGGVPAEMVDTLTEVLNSLDLDDNTSISPGTVEVDDWEVLS
jgi:hypothetical protein